MLPQALADFALQPETRVTDAGLAARVHAAAAGPRVLVFGSVRLGLVEALLDLGLDVVVVDSSRRALLQAEAALAAGGRDGKATLLAQDPRELEIPDGADAIVLPSITWRAVEARDRADILDAFAKTLRPGGVLCLDLERVATAARGEAWRAAGAVTVALEDGPEVVLSAAEPEVLIEEARAAGLVVARTEPIGADDAAHAPCLFAVAGRPA